MIRPSQVFADMRIKFEEMKPQIALNAANAAKNYFVDIFDMQETPSGENWQELSEYTVAHRKYPDQPILVQTGALRTALTKSVETGSISFEQSILTVENEYAAQHNYGYPEKGLPAREFMGLSLGVEIAVEESIKNTFLGIGDAGSITTGSAGIPIISAGGGEATADTIINESTTSDLTEYIKEYKKKHPDSNFFDDL